MRRLPTVALCAMSFLSWLPIEDVLHESIFPLLDYESRINLNRCLEPYERFRPRHFSDGDLQAHDHFATLGALTLKMDRIQITDLITNKKRRLRARAFNIMNMIAFLGYHPSAQLFLRRYHKMRNVWISKLTTWSDPNHASLITSSVYIREKISRLARRALSILMALEPFPNIVRAKQITISMN